MYKILICVLTLFSSEICLCRDKTLEETELVLTFMVHRHGDRTPIQDTIPFAINKEKVLERSQKYGFGQLTDKGKETGYKLGQFIRHRYDILLSERYNRSEIYIRSTDSTRTKMTVLAAMSAVYPGSSDDPWTEEDINWTPVPYTTVHPKYDGLLATINCPAITNSYFERLQVPVPSMAKYTNVLNEISDTLGIKLVEMPVALYIIYDTFISQMHLGVPLTRELEELLPEIEEGAAVAFDVMFAHEKYLALQAGVLLNEFYDAVDALLSGKDVPRVNVYSAHDVNVYTFSAACGITPRLGVPKYGSLFALELRVRQDSGVFIVVPLFLEEPGANAVYLKIKGCEGVCTLDRFRLLTSKYLRNEKEYRTECGFREDMEIDTSSID